MKTKTVRYFLHEKSRDDGTEYFNWFEGTEKSMKAFIKKTLKDPHFNYMFTKIEDSLFYKI